MTEEAAILRKRAVKYRRLAESQHSQGDAETMVQFAEELEGDATALDEKALSRVEAKPK